MKTAKIRWRLGAWPWPPAAGGQIPDCGSGDCGGSSIAADPAIAADCDSSDCGGSPIAEDTR